MKNSSQDENYVGKPYHEKAVHHWQFTMPRNLKNRKDWKSDPNWVYVGVGRWKYIPKETRKTGRESAED